MPGQQTTLAPHLATLIREHLPAQEAPGGKGTRSSSSKKGTKELNESQLGVSYSWTQPGPACKLWLLLCGQRTGSPLTAPPHAQVRAGGDTVKGLERQQSGQLPPHPGWSSAALSTQSHWLDGRGQKRPRRTASCSSWYRRASPPALRVSR